MSVDQPVPTGTGAGAGTAWYTAPRQEPPDDGDARPGTDRHLSEDWTAGVLDGPIHTAIDTYIGTGMHTYIQRSCVGC